MRGQFTVHLPEGDLIVPNQVVSEGIESFLKMIFNASTADVAGAGNFYIGICGSTVSSADTLASISNEPSASGGYARQAVTRDATGWPTISKVNGIWRAKSAIVNFAATGADYSQTLTRLFLTNAASGAVGKLFAYSAALLSPFTITDGSSYPASYEFFLDS